jgi:hypothetical protein
MHTREKVLNRLILFTCCDICRLSKCPTKKTIDKVVPNNIKKLGLRKGRKRKLGRQYMPNK